ncbi:MAG: ABC transporter ATP-binding protein [Vagococcus sp.]|uniref:energy-coupling factor ABC transporter ATP-binding protein n=1 Tax=Vagococcus sp. TaxID=1933889 RepID=UPI002FC8F05D
MGYITCQNVTYQYPLADKPILDDISLTVNQGEFIGIVGQNGAGKTTLCNALRGFAPHFYKGDFSGNITIDNQVVNELNQLSDIAQLVGYVFQNPFTQMSGIEDTVFHEIAFGLENLGIEKEHIITLVNNTLEELDLTDIKDKHPLYLSGGQQQKVALASVLAMNPDILIADEPTSQLDPAATKEIFALLKANNTRGKTIFLVEHKIDYLYDYASRILVIHEGKIVIDEKPEVAFLDERLESFGVEMPKMLELGKLLKDTYQLESLPTKKDDIEEILTFYRSRK